MAYFSANDPSNRSLIDRLMEDGVSESLHLDYKSTLPGKNDANRKEFALDVSAFLNAMGGRIIFGVVETKGVPISIQPFTDIDRDSEQLRLTQILHSVVQPRAEFYFNWIECGNDKYILELIIPPSSSLPHRVFINHHEYYWVRDATGKHQMSMDELKNKFIGFNRAKSVFEEQVIKLSDAFEGRAVVLKNKTFRRCVFKGPANVMFSGGVRLRDISNAECVVVSDDASIRNAVLFDNCTIEDCDLENATMFLIPEQYKNLDGKMKSGIPLLTKI